MKRIPGLPTRRPCGASVISLLAASFAIAGASFAAPEFEATWRSHDTSLFNQARFAMASALADFNGDALLDLAIGNWWAPSQMTVILNEGDGDFGPPAYYPMQSFMGSLEVVAADINRDGHPDVVASNSGANYEGAALSYFRNLGSGTFASQVLITAATGGLRGPVGLAAADFTGDGWTDIAVALYGFPGTTVALLANNQTGGLSPPVFFPTGARAYKLAAGDLDGDTRPDLAVACEDQKVVVLRNSGGGSFASPVVYTAFDSTDPDPHPAVALADFDCDGDLDVAYSSSFSLSPTHPGHGVAALFDNLGGGVFDDPVPTEIAAGGVDLAAADVTGDQWPDLLAVHGSSHGWSVVVNDGTGGFPSLSYTYYATGELPFSIEVGDADRDGDQDPVIANRYSIAASVHENPGNGDFRTQTAYPAAPAGIWMDSADIDLDGDLDVATAYQNLAAITGGIRVLKNLGGGAFAPAIDYFSPLAARAVKLRNLDEDAYPDLLWADDFPPYDFKTRRNLGDGTFGPLVNWSNQTCGNGDIEAGDMDGDGDLDVFLGEDLACVSIPESGRRFFINRNRGDGTFDPPVIFNFCSGPRSIALADLNGDTHLDLAATGACVALGNGDGTFDLPQFYDTDTGSRFIVAGDWNGDKAMDLATANFGSDQGAVGQQSLAILTGVGNGTFLPPAVYPGALSPQLVGVSGLAAGDVDGDLFLDLMISNSAAGDVSLFRNRGDGTFDPHERYGVGWTPDNVLFGDFTGDGEGDLAFLVGALPSLIPKQLTILPGLRSTTGLPAEEHPHAAPSPSVSLLATTPNPFREGTRLSYALAAAGRVRLTVSDVLGRHVATLVDEALPAGAHVATWDGRSARGELVAPGIYFAEIESSGRRTAAKLVRIQ